MSGFFVDFHSPFYGLVGSTVAVSTISSDSRVLHFVFSEAFIDGGFIDINGRI